MRRQLLAAAFAASMVFPLAAFAVGGPSGPKVEHPVPGKIGEVVVNPYKIAPLTAVIRNGGYVLKDASVRIVPKPGGVEIKYKVADNKLLTYGGIPIFGLYPDYYNTVEVSYTRIWGSKSERIENEVYRFHAPALFGQPSGLANKTAFFEVKVKRIDPEFKDRLYLINNLQRHPTGALKTWNSPTGGALEWDRATRNVIIDTAGDVRWYLYNDALQDFSNMYRGGVMMGFKQNPDGALSWGFGQTLVKYDIMGRQIFDRRLPDNYIDFSHSLDVSPNGHFFARVASANYKRPDGKNVRTVRDVIAEIDQNGEVVDEWRLFEILDPYRSVNIKALDQGAVCLNIDPSKAGQTLSSEELAAMDTNNVWGDVPGVGAGRNWAHVNSVDHDPSDDSIIISSRHQSAIVKIGRDKKVKWILGSPEGWRKGWAEKVLTPVDASGRPLKCKASRCEGDFDWTWTQHTAFRIDAKSDERFLYLSVFDNGDSRGMEQPVFAEDKYSRAVIYRIDQKNMTVEQLWEYGKERGNAWYSAVTSLTEYQPDKDSVFVYSATAGAAINAEAKRVGPPSPYLDEFKWGAHEPSVEIQVIDCQGYQAMPFVLEKAMDPAGYRAAAKTAAKAKNEEKK